MTRIIALSISLLVTPAALAQGQPSGQSCMDRYLVDKLGPDRVSVLTTAWASAATKPEKWADGFYEQFGRRTIDDAIARFIEVRWDMHAHCHDVPDLDLD